MTFSPIKWPLAFLLIFSLALLPTTSSKLYACLDEIGQPGQTQVAFLPNRRGLDMPEIDRPEIRRARVKAKIIDLTKKIASEGKTAERFAERAELHVQLDQKHWAVVDYDDAIKLDPKNYSMRDRRLALNRELENFDQIEIDLNELVELDKSAIRYLERAQFYAERDENEKAEQDFTLAIEFDPNLADAYLGRGRIIYERRTQVDGFKVEIEGFTFNNPDAIAEAAVDLNKAVQLKPDLIEPRRTLIIAYMDLKMYDKAIEQATAILERLPEDECAKYYRSKSYRQQRKYDLALADLSDLIEQRPEASKYFALRAEIYRETGNIDKAVEDYLHNIEIDGGNYATHGLFARYLISNKRYPEAIKAYSKAIELNKHDKGIQTEFYSQRGNAYFWLKQYEEAQSDLGKAAELAQFPDYYKMQRGRILVTAKRYDDANAVYEDMMDDNPRRDDCFLERARMFIVMKEYDKALKDVNTFLIPHDTNPEAYEIRAVIWKHMGNEKAAQEDLQKVEDLKKAREERFKKSRAQREQTGNK